MHPKVKEAFDEYNEDSPIPSAVALRAYKQFDGYDLPFEQIDKVTAVGIADGEYDKSVVLEFIWRHGNGVEDRIGFAFEEKENEDSYFWVVSHPWQSSSGYMKVFTICDIFVDVIQRSLYLNKHTKLNTVSDGYHSFDELYDHRHALFIALMRSHQSMSWRSRRHDDGSGFDGWFIAGMHLPTGDITYHLPERLWGALDGVKELDLAPKWDGHTSADVVKRLSNWNSQ